MSHRHDLPESDSKSQNSKQRDNKEVIPNEKIQWYVHNKYFGSWLFRIPILVLMVAATFAVMGVIQIQNLRVDLNQLADESIERIELDLQEQRTEIGDELNKLEEMEKNRITTEVNNHIKNLKREVAPDVEEELKHLDDEITSLETRTAPLESRYDTLKNQVRPLDDTLKAIDPTTNRRQLESAAIVLNSSLLLIWGIGTLSILAIALTLTLTLTKNWYILGGVIIGVLAISVILWCIQYGVPNPIRP